MQYDKLILELLNRVQILEERISKLEYSGQQNIGNTNGKYFKLTDVLKSSNKNTMKFTFSELESLLGFELPKSARNHRAFWANTDTHSISLNWLSAGYEVSNIDIEIGEVEFSKISFLQNEKKGKKEFSLKGENFVLEIGYRDGRTFRLLKKTTSGFIDFEGNQKRFIVEKLKELKNTNPNLNIDDNVKNYIDNYGPGNTQGQNSNKLAKLLYRLLPMNKEEQK